MFAVIASLVAVVLVVLVVVAMGMRSMSRRESALPADRRKKMAEQAESRPELSSDDFATREPRVDYFTPDFSPIDEPEEKRPRPQRPGARGRRGVNEWGEADDYDEDYWSKVRDDEGGFGGSIAAKRGAPRPVGAPDDAPREGAAPRAREDAAGADEPTRRTPAVPAARPGGLADLVEPNQQSRPPSGPALADQKTMMFNQPPEAGGQGGAGRPADQGRGPARPANAPRRTGGTPRRGASTPPRRNSPPAQRSDTRASSRPDPLAGPPRPASRPARPEGRPGAGAGKGEPPSGARPGRPDPLASPTASARPDPLTGAPDSARTGRPDPLTGTPDLAGTGPARAGRPDPLTGAPDSARTGRPDPLAGTPDLVGTGPARGGRPDPLADPLAAPHGQRPGGRPDPLTGPLPADVTQRMPLPKPDPLSDPLAADPLSTGRRGRPAAASGRTRENAPRPETDASPTIDPLSTGGHPLSPGHLAAGRIAEGDPLSTGPFSGRSASATSGQFPAADASRQEDRHSYSWSGTADILDDPPAASAPAVPASASGSWPAPPVQSFPAVTSASGQQGGESYPTNSYEVRAGWAMIDESDTVTGPSRAMSTPTGPSRTVPAGGYDSPADDVLSGGGGPYAAPVPDRYPPAQPSPQSGNWPSYSELYGQPEAEAVSDGSGRTGGRSGNHRAPETDYPDYYR
ncbi:hypothetical protein DP939_13090 [Spongiactinospora rosea]|uniref:Uncharacterized protein n=1 Tax=Spongiactinospora rosea TaxID=2248750 RepID=A0A366M0E5_9ACTN|nr:hypothetical protein [Spongiactinospora rosea]RBQ19665.1 hypothetical protein DP939_13090 [Spongiactinospora rosea]